MISDTSLSIIVISDLHCKYSGNDKTAKSTNLYSDMARKPTAKNPASAFLSLIKAKKIKADVLLCPGDICDHADRQGLVTGWSYLEEFKRELDCEILAASVGNHDVNSYKLNDSPPFDFLKSLKDSYPIDNEEEVKAFWSEGFCVIEKDPYVILIYNSSFSHIGIDESRKSEIKDDVLEKMEQRMSNLKHEPKFRIALCHHHASKHFSKDYPDSDVMDKGDLFINFLNKFNFQILIHGHKHDPRLTIINRLPVLCSGSFSSLMNIMDIGANNVFHIITLEPNEKKGKIQTWVYLPLNGWQIRDDAYFPCYTGFGFYGSVNSLVDHCAAWFLAQGQNHDHFANIIRQFPEIEFLTPAEQIVFGELLLSQYSIELSSALGNKPKTISKQLQ